MNLSSIHKLKLRIVLTVFLLFALGIIAMLIKWQVFDSEAYVAIANERFRDMKIPALRGSILSSDGSSLAFSEPRYDVYVWLPELERAESRGYQTQQEFIDNLSGILNQKPEEIKATLESGPLWLKIASKITVDQKKRIQDTRLDTSGRSIQGLQFEYVNKRVYPEGKLASQIVGFVGQTTNGQEKGVGGLEQYWEGSLKPQEGFESGEFDSFGNPITIGENAPLEPKPGMTLYTTINKTLQRKLEKNLRKGLVDYKAESVTGIIMDPKTGAILAMANMPDFDPNEYFKEVDGKVFGNKAISVPYEVGSVAKTFTLSSAFDLETLEPLSTLLPNGHNGCEIISPNPPEDAQCFVNRKDGIKIDCICTYDRKPHKEPLTPKDSLVNSDNIGFHHIALTMAYSEFHDYLDRFGVGKPTGIELAGESIGYLKDSKDWNYADQAVFSYGHGYQITPLQAITGVAAIANDGKRMQPYIVQKVVDAEGKEKVFNPIIIEEVIKPSTADAVSQIMHQVYENNIPEREYRFLSDYYISLKSGTALVAYTDRAGYSSDINATYVGFDASPEKKFVLLIKIEKPAVGDLSFYNARRLWLDTFIDIKDDLGVPEYKR